MSGTPLLKARIKWGLRSEATQNILNAFIEIRLLLSFRVWSAHFTLLLFLLTDRGLSANSNVSENTADLHLSVVGRSFWFWIGASPISDIYPHTYLIQSFCNLSFFDP